jgi:hypothetical protein
MAGFLSLCVIVLALVSALNAALWASVARSAWMPQDSADRVLRGAAIIRSKRICGFAPFYGKLASE